MDELIKRQDALDALCDACTLASVKSECIFKNLESCMDHNAILDVPAVEERWIPCSERLPDMHDEVLVTARGEVSIAWLYVDGKWRSNDMPQPMFRDIIAWMPLPEPYKGDRNEHSN